MSSSSESVAQLINRLQQEGAVAAAETVVPHDLLTELGLPVVGGSVCWPEHLEPLNRDRIAASLDDQAFAHPMELEVLSAVGSTNDWLREAMQENVHGWRAVTAECQLAGKGRLGRRWITPIGGSIAVSVGMRLQQPASELGGLSLVVGLAVLDALDPQGQFQLALKWPNDIQAGSAKLGGILIEIVRSQRDCTDLIIGIGLNYQLAGQVRAQIDKEVVDIATLGIPLGRNVLIGSVLGQLSGFVTAFEQRGFGDFQAAFNAVHAYHGKECRLVGSSEVLGRVQGVDDQGQLLLEADGAIRHFNAGEVSLRER